MLVANTYSDSTSVIDISSNTVTRTIELELPIKMPGTIHLENPPATNFKPWTHVPNLVPLDDGVTASIAKLQTASPAVQALQIGWLRKKAETFAGKLTKPDSEDPDTVNHLDWYEATGFTVPYPGEKTVRPASDFDNPAPTNVDEDE